LEPGKIRARSEAVFDGLRSDRPAIAASSVLRRGSDVEDPDAAVTNPCGGGRDRPAVEWLRAIGEAMQSADVSKEKADLMHAIYERITVAGPEIVGVRLTQAAYAHGLALALPERLKWRARQDSNLRPSAPEADALSTELQAREPR
jgi:hypothetical protein